MSHPRIEQRQANGPARVRDQLPRHNLAARFNSWLAIKITDAVGTMWCAYAFTALALVSLPDAIHHGRSALISWIAQTFIQLVLLSIIMVGQGIQAAAADKRAEDTYEDADAVLTLAQQILNGIKAQDQELSSQDTRIDHIETRLNQQDETVTKAIAAAVDEVVRRLQPASGNKAT